MVVKCVHSKEDNACEDNPKVQDKNCNTINRLESCDEQENVIFWGDDDWLDGHKRDLPHQDKQLCKSLPKEMTMRVCRKMYDDHVGPAADRGDGFFNRISYLKYSINELVWLGDKCLNEPHGQCKSSMC